MLEILLGILAMVLVAVLWQHIHFLKIRRNLAQDQQNLLHTGEVFHVIVFFKLKTGEKLVEATRRFKQLILSTGNTRLIYAGQAAYTVTSQQLSSREWDGVLMFEYRSRPDYEQARADPRTAEARRLFADSYIHGMRRNRKASLVMPQLLLRHRLKKIFTGKWRVAPLQPSVEVQTSSLFQPWRNRVSRLRALHVINRQGLVTYNLIKYGAARYQGTEDTFGSDLVWRMAAMGHGPLHVGRSVALEEFARFDRVYVMYYPSAHYFADLLSSQYFHDIADNRRLGDAFRVPTIPITLRL
jgi:hypothetical protein